MHMTQLFTCHKILSNIMYPIRYILAQYTKLKEFEKINGVDINRDIARCVNSF